MINIKDISSKKLDKEFYLIPFPEGERVKVTQGVLKGLEVIYTKEDLVYILDRWDIPDQSFVERRSSIIRELDLCHGIISNKKDIRHSLLPTSLVRGYDQIIRQHERNMEYEALKGSLVFNPLGLYEKTTKRNLNRIFIPRIGHDFGILITTDKNTLFIDHRIHGILMAKVNNIDDFSHSIYESVKFSYTWKDKEIKILEVTK